MLQIFDILSNCSESVRGVAWKEFDNGWRWVAVTAGISTNETEFLANIVLPDNTTAGEWMIPQIDQAYRTGEMPPLLLAAGNSDRRSSGPIALPPA